MGSRYFQKMNHIVHAAKFSCVDTARELVVLNVHLKNADENASIRALQLCLALRQLRDWAGSANSFILCGDFNNKDDFCPKEMETCLESVLQLVTTGNVAADHLDFVFGRNIGLRREEKFDCPCCGAERHPRRALCNACHTSGKNLPSDVLLDAFACELAQPLRFNSAYHSRRETWALFQTHEMCGIPWKHWWAESKDHIFASQDLDVAWVLAPPKIADLCCMPNLCWSSDHIAMVADLKWRVV